MRFTRWEGRSSDETDSWSRGGDNEGAGYEEQEDEGEVSVEVDEGVYDVSFSSGKVL